VIVGLDAERVSILFVEHHDARISFGQDVRVLDIENVFPEKDLGALVTAMLAPRLGNGLDLDIGRYASPFWKYSRTRFISSNERLRPRSVLSSLSCPSLAEKTSTSKSSNGTSRFFSNWSIAIGLTA
jgi:hypothetical protein